MPPDTPRTRWAALGAPGTLRRRLVRNAGWSAVSFLLNAIVVFFLSPYVVRGLGTDAYGTWGVLQTLTGYLNLVDFGIRPAIVHFVARHDAVGDRDAVSRYVNSSLATFGVGGALALVIGAAILPWLPGWFAVPAALRIDTIVAGAISVLSVAVALPLNALSAVLVGKQRFDISGRIDLLTLVAGAGMTVYVIAAGHGLVGLAAVNFVVLLANMGLKAREALRVEPSLRFSRGLIGWRECRGLLEFGALNLVVVGASQLIFRTDALVIGATVGVTWVAFYAVGASLPNQVQGMVWSVGRVLEPAMGALDAQGDRATMMRLYVRSARLLLLLAGPVVVYLLVLGPAFLERWMGDVRFRERSGPVLVVLAVSMVFHVAAYPLYALHRGANRMRSLALFGLVEGVANLGASLVLVHRLGILGVALGTAIPSFVVRGLALPAWVCRQFGARWTAVTAGIWVTPLLTGAATYVALRATVATGASYGWLSLVGFAAGVVAAFGAIAWGFDRILRRFDRGNSG